MRESTCPIREVLIDINLHQKMWIPHVDATLNLHERKRITSSLSRHRHFPSVLSFFSRRYLFQWTDSQWPCVSGWSQRRSAGRFRREHGSENGMADEGCKLQSACEGKASTFRAPFSSFWDNWIAAISSSPPGRTSFSLSLSLSFSFFIESLEIRGTFRHQIASH